MCRFEFYEALVRIAAAKFKDTGIEEFYIDSFKRLLKENIIPNAGVDIDQWSKWRENFLWTLEINDILEANLDNLKKLFKACLQPKKTTLGLTEALGVMTKDSGVYFTEKETIQAYGMSKMTNWNEIAGRDKYN